MARYATAIMQIKIKEAEWFGKFIVVGSVPATCANPQTHRSLCFETEADALAAILADPWIKDTPEQMIQLAGCSVYAR